MKYFYMVWMPGDDEDGLDWFQVYPDKRSAVAEGKGQAEDRGWEFKYLKSYLKSGGVSHYDYMGKKTIVVEQVTHYYHGA